MTSLDEGRGRTAAFRLLDIAGPNMYRRNPFRITGLPTGASSRQVRERRMLVLGALRMGATVPPSESWLELPTTPTPEEVRAAFDELDNAEYRIVDELLWRWGDPGECDCSETVHRLHDAAVLAHARAIDLETSSDVPGAQRARSWVEAADAWASALRHEDLWQHLDHRVRALADRRLNESTIAGLRTSLPAALLAPQSTFAATNASAAPLADLIDKWPFDRTVLDDARTTAATPAFDELISLINELGSLLDAGKLDDVIKRGLSELTTAAHRLNQLAPHRRFRRSRIARDQAAAILNNCAMALMDRPSHNGHKHIERLFSEALKLAVDPDTRHTIAENRALRQVEKPSTQPRPNNQQAGNLAQTARGSRPPAPTYPVRPPQPAWKQRLYDAADSLLDLRLLTIDQVERARIDDLLTKVRAALSQQQVNPTLTEKLLAEIRLTRVRGAGWSRLHASIAVCLAYFALVIHLLLGFVHLSDLLTYLVVVVSAPVPVAVLHIGALVAMTRKIPAILRFFGICVSAAFLCLVAKELDPEPVLIYFIGFLSASLATFLAGLLFATRRDKV